MLFLFAIGVSAQNADLHINFEDRGLKVMNIFELGDDGFLIEGKEHGEKHFEAYSPDLKLKWQANVSKSQFSEGEPATTQVLYNADRIFICTENALDKYDILAFDHDGKLTNMVKSLSVKGAHVCFCPLPTGLGIFTKDNDDLVSKLKYWYIVLDNSLRTIKNSELNFGGNVSYVGTDGTNTYLSGVYSRDEKGASGVDVLHIDGEGIAHKDFHFRVKPGNLYSSNFQMKGDYGPYVSVRYDPYSNTFYAYSMAGKQYQNLDNWKNFYLQHYDAKGKLMADSVYSFKDVQSRVPNFPDAISGQLNLELYTDRSGKVYMAFYNPKLKSYHDGCIMFDENLDIAGGVCDSKKANLISNPYKGLGLYQQTSTHYTYQVNKTTPESKVIEQHSDKSDTVFCTLYRDNDLVIVGALDDGQFDVYRVKVK